jgi:hypothetical protein
MIRRIDLMKAISTHWVLFAIVLLELCISSCVNKSTPIPQAEYSTKIVGLWQGTVGDSKETMSIHGDGTFVCKLFPTGFIANTLSQGVAGTVRGTWKITRAVITLKITGAEKENLRNTITSSIIVAFKENELVLKSDSGKTSAFGRVYAL